MAISVAFLPLALFALAAELLSLLPCSTASGIGLRMQSPESGAMHTAVAGLVTLQVVRSLRVREHRAAHVALEGPMRLPFMLCVHPGSLRWPSCPPPPGAAAAVAGPATPFAHSSHQRLGDNFLGYARLRVPATFQNYSPRLR